MVISRKLGLPDLTFVEMDHVSIDSQSKIFGFNSGKPVPMSLRAARNEPIVLALEREILPDSDNHTVHMSSHFEKYVRNDGRRCDAMKLVFLKDDEQAHLYRTYYSVFDCFILWVWINCSKLSWFGTRKGHYMPGDLQGRFRISDGGSRGTFYLTDVSALSTQAFAFDNGIQNMGPSGAIDEIAARAFECLEAAHPALLKSFLTSINKTEAFFSDLKRTISSTSTGSSAQTKTPNAQSLLTAFTAGVLTREEYFAKLKSINESNEPCVGPTQKRKNTTSSNTPFTRSKKSSSA